MKKYAILAVCCLVLFFGAGTIFAQQGGFIGPVVPSATVRNTAVQSQYQNVTVSQLSSLPNKSYVVLTGNLVNFDGRKYYTFQDTTGEVAIEISARHLWGISVGPNDRVTILVEVERKRDGRIEVESKVVRRV